MLVLPGTQIKYIYQFAGWQSRVGMLMVYVWGMVRGGDEQIEGTKDLL